ncbi:LuxR family transcriptional regulator [Sulfitobacter sp. R18_1]|uniref:LuxR family transcriptional regulator n=1 Tax=Sulfitobacter sp. R18_1 TaxID=2821104 RepID=UPI001AD9AC85|nr:LuxR family transcriptional regulator [Sulfitobacter sp. R18_1]MBO9428325.1 LuxR family transcriptional regulator [Sulfitobacter sp. R18_1]
MRNLKISDQYSEISSRNPDVSMKDVLHKLCNEAGLNNITYLALTEDSQLSTEAKIFSTYDEGWTNRYQEQKYHLIDPVVVEGLTSILPVDWSKLTKKDKLTKDFFGEAAEWGVCENGLTIPIRDFAKRRAILSVNTEMNTREWNKYQREFVADFTYLSYLIHDDVIKNDASISQEVELTPRETEMLRWAAIGKTSWETAQITGLTERTVNFFLTNACKKLHAGNRVSAVAKAISYGLISI